MHIVEFKELKTALFLPIGMVSVKVGGESLMHIFFLCPFVASYWNRLFSLFNIQWCWPNKSLDALLQPIEDPYLKA